jgi:hypothetical protein
MVTYKTLFSSSLTNLKEITLQRNKLITAIQSIETDSKADWRNSILQDIPDEIVVFIKLRQVVMTATVDPD